MAKDIQWMGAIFPDVPSITLPQQGGGLASFDDTSDGDIQPADVAQGKIGYAQGQRVVGTAVAPSGSQTFTNNGTYDVTALAEAVINVAGGGGASNIVTGTFTTEAENGTHSVEIPYSGDGWMVSMLIYPAEGAYNPQEGSWYNLIQQYAVGIWAFCKCLQSTAPTYAYLSQDTRDKVSTVAMYKSNKTSATSYSGSAQKEITIYDKSSVPRAQFSDCIILPDKTHFKYYTNASGAGFPPNITYKYIAIYSS